MPLLSIWLQSPLQAMTAASKLTPTPLHVRSSRGKGRRRQSAIPAVPIAPRQSTLPRTHVRQTEIVKLRAMPVNISATTVLTQGFGAGAFPKGMQHCPPRLETTKSGADHGTPSGCAVREPQSAALRLRAGGNNANRRRNDLWLQVLTKAPEQRAPRLSWRNRPWPRGHHLQRNPELFGRQSLAASLRLLGPGLRSGLQDWAFFSCLTSPRTLAETSARMPASS